ncbi:MAG TPA: outer membrane protein assembly factor BamE [Rhizomicrobium sp.]|nr:outer membrane protein assembly factor BamE [Rhizomicrobium sp.]
MRIRALLLIAIFAASCTPVVTQRGYLADPVLEKSLKPGDDTKTTVQSRLGYPSTQATFGGDTWYYISSSEKRVAFFDPRVTNRLILAVYFDKNSKLTDVKRYTLKDGHVVDFETRETPTRGREMTFLQQLFNATPGVPLGGNQQQNPGGGSGPGG